MDIGNSALSPSNINCIKRFQNKVLRDIVTAPWYLRNINFQHDFRIDMVEAEIIKGCRLHDRTSVEGIQLSDHGDHLRGLK